MALNKEAYIRYKLIDKMLRDKRKPFPSMEDFQDAMQEKLGKSFAVSTIQKDIKAMKQDTLLNYYAPIKWSKSNNGYYYTDANFSIAQVSLSEEDLNSLEFAASILQQFKDLKIFGNFGGTVDKIFNAINVNSILSEEEIEESIQFEKAPYFEGSKWLEELLNHIKEKECVSIAYKKFDSDEVRIHQFHPYLLKEYRNRWYLIGMNNKNGYINTFGLDRIQNIATNSIPYRYHLDFSPKTYFNHAFGIIVFDKDKVEKIQLRFNTISKQYVKTQPLHESQKIISENKEELIVELNVGITIELIMAIMSFGENVTVLSPSTLVEEIKEKLKAAAKNYTN